MAMTPTNEILRVQTAAPVLSAAQRTHITADFDNKKFIENREFASQLREFNQDRIQPIGEMIPKSKLLVARSHLSNVKGSFTNGCATPIAYTTMLSSPTRANTYVGPEPTSPNLNHILR